MLDVRHAVRRLVRDWPFTVPALLVLALGIGANAVTFSVVDRTLFRPLAYEHPEELVNLYQNQGRAAEPVGSSYPAYRDMAGYTDIFSGVTAFTWPLPVRYQGEGGLAEGLVEFAAPGYGEVHGLSPALGRWFGAEEARPGAEPVVVLNHHTWTSRFDGDPSVLGATIRIAGAPATVVGVAPEGYSSSLHSGLVTDFWVPVSAAGRILGDEGLLERRQGNEFMVRARLREGVTPTQAQAAMTALGTHLADEYPEADPGRGISVIPAQDVLVHPQLDRMVNAGASLLLVVVAMLLAIVCTNLATWLLVRGLERGKEVSVRLALGASRSRVVGLLVVESTVLAALGGAAGALLAHWTLGVAARLDLPVDLRGGLDLRVLGLTVALSLVTGVAFGLVPALRATRGAPAPALRGGGDGSAGGRRFGLKHALVGAQIVLSCVLLGVEGVYVRAFLASQDRSLGFDVDALAFVETDGAFAGYGGDELQALHDRLVARVAALPGVEAATSLVAPPPGTHGGSAAIIDGYEPVEGESLYLPWVWAGPDDFRVLGIPLVRGRGFADADGADAPPVVVVNERFVRRYFGDAEPLGRRLRLSADPGAPTFEVVGVVADVRLSLQDAPEPLVYRARAQGTAPLSTVVVRTSGDPAALVGPLRQAVRELDPAVPIVEAATLRGRLAADMAAQRSVVALVGALGVLGLVLASLGLYAVMAFAVSRRRREIGIRTALGARRGTVLRTLSRDVVGMMSASLAVGLGLAWLLVRSLGGMVSSMGEAEGVNLTAAPSVDAGALALVALLMAAVGLTATLLPAWRAAGGSPQDVLRDS